jgi:hypothetical protein
MSEMTARMDNVRAFYNVIERHVALKLSCKIDVSDLKRAIDRIWMERVSIVYGDWNNPYFVCFRGLMDLFHEARFDERTTKIIPVDKKVDFYFDKHTSSKSIHLAWEDYIAKRSPEHQLMYGNEPRFEDDEECLPLQAADFWAWCVRKGFDEHRIEDVLANDFGAWKGAKPIPGLSITVSEDDIASTFYRMAREQMGPEIMIYDTSPPTSFLSRLKKLFRW